MMNLYAKLINVCVLALCIFVVTGCALGTAQPTMDQRLCVAAEQGNMEEVRSILEAKPELATIESAGGKALLRAISQGHFRIVEFLIANGVDVNTKGGGGETALHYAVSEKNWEILEQLVSSGADVHITNKSGKTILASVLSLGDNWRAEDADWDSVEHLAQYHVAGAEEVLLLKQLAAEKGLDWPQNLNRPEPIDWHKIDWDKVVPNKNGEKTVDATPYFQQVPVLHGQECEGHFQIRIKNSNEFAVLAAVRGIHDHFSDIVCARNLLIPPESTNAVSVFGNAYAVYFVYANEPDAIYKGESVGSPSTSPQISRGVEIQLTKVKDGNYKIRRVE